MAHRRECRHDEYRVHMDMDSFGNRTFRIPVLHPNCPPAADRVEGVHVYCTFHSAAIANDRVPFADLRMASW